MVPAKFVIELPQSGADKEQFAQGHQVLALYPNTSCFYRATVVCPPIKVLSLKTFEPVGNFNGRVKRRWKKTSHFIRFVSKTTIM
jgi:hypothetical protein